MVLEATAEPSAGSLIQCWQPARPPPPSSHTPCAGERRRVISVPSCMSRAPSNHLGHGIGMPFRGAGTAPASSLPSSMATPSRPWNTSPSHRIRSRCAVVVEPGTMRRCSDWPQHGAFLLPLCNDEGAKGCTRTHAPYEVLPAPVVFVVHVSAAASCCATPTVNLRTVLRTPYDLHLGLMTDCKSHHRRLGTRGPASERFMKRSPLGQQPPPFLGSAAGAGRCRAVTQDSGSCLSVVR